MPLQLPSREGITRFDPATGGWARLSELKKSGLAEGFNIVYFRNLMCSACRLLDIKFPDLVDMYSCRATITVVTCMWFSKLCLTHAAGRAFEEFKVRESPTIYAALVRGGSIVREAVIIGTLSLSEYRSYLAKAIGLRACSKLK